MYLDKLAHSQFLFLAFQSWNFHILMVKVFQQWFSMMHSINLFALLAVHLFALLAVHVQQ